MNIEKDIVKKIFKCNQDYSIFNGVEKIIIALSGGKDSLTLLRLLSLIYPPVLLYPVHVYPYKNEEILNNLELFSKKFIPNPVTFLDNTFSSENCYTCARGRRRALLETAEKNNIKKIALGHNKNDVAETFLMNIFFSGNIDTITPCQDFFDGKFQFIRPLYFVDEKDILRYKRIFHIEPQDYKCHGKTLNKRETIRKFLKIPEINPDNKLLHRVFTAALKGMKYWK